MDAVQEIATTPRKRAKRKPRQAADLDVLRAADLLMIEQFCLVNPAFTPGGVRWLVFREGEKLEQSGAIARVGRRVLLRPKKFLDFVISKPEHRRTRLNDRAVSGAEEQERGGSGGRDRAAENRETTPDGA